jgi:hypothetical protein
MQQVGRLLGNEEAGKDEADSDHKCSDPAGTKERLSVFLRDDGDEIGRSSGCPIEVEAPC